MDNKSLFINLGNTNEKTYFLKQIIYGLQKNGYSSINTFKLENKNNFLFEEELISNQTLKIYGQEFFNVSNFDEKITIIDSSLSLEDFFNLTNESILECTNDDIIRFLRILCRAQLNVFFVVPIEDIKKDTLLIKKIMFIMNFYNYKNINKSILKNKINLLFIQNVGLWKSQNKNVNKILNEINNLLYLDSKYKNPFNKNFINVIDFYAMEDFSIIEDEIYSNILEDSLNKIKTQEQLKLFLKFQKESENLFNAYNSFL